MHKVKIRTDGAMLKSFKMIVLSVSLLIIAFPALILCLSDYGNGFINATVLRNMLILGLSMLILFMISSLFLSRISPAKSLKLRKKLILFTRQFTKMTDDGLFRHSVEWKYRCTKDKITIELFPDALISDTAETGRRLSEYLRLNLLKFRQSQLSSQYVFGNFPERFDGMKLLCDDELKTIPIYDNINWDLDHSGCHMLVLAPTGAGKTVFLNYLASSVLKQGHELYVIDAKNTSFGAMYNCIRKTATAVEDIIQLLNELVADMEKDYETYFSDEKLAGDVTFRSLGLPAHVLIFDEVLSALKSGNKKQNEEMERLLCQLALKGRSAGYIIVLTSQRLLASDLPKAINDQCQTRILLGANVSEELFHLATNSYYKKDLATSYMGGTGKGYAVTPEHGLSYIETPWMSYSPSEFRNLIISFSKRGRPYGTGY